MLKKFIKIFSIGKFHNYSASGDVELKKFNLIYGENGFGKTTISAILRSLHTNEPHHITERATLGHGTDPEAHILIEAEVSKFVQGAWDRHHPHIEIFDSMFISKNVFSGDRVEHGHMKSLYRFAVGDQGVLLANSVDDLAAEIARTSEAILNQKRVVEASIKHRMSLEDFLGLQEDSDIPSQLADAQAQLVAVRKSADIARRPQLNLLILPDYGTEMTGSILSKTLVEVSKDAEQKMKDHIARCMHDQQGEAWIQKGMGYVKDGLCPFCGHACDSDLVSAYGDYFNDAYESLKSEISGQLLITEAALSDRMLGNIQTLLASNAAAYEFWSAYVEAPAPVVEFDTISGLWKSIATGLSVPLQNKMRAPLEIIGGESLEQVQPIIDTLKEVVEVYNQQVNLVNQQIAIKRQTVGSADMQSILVEIQRLENLEVRHESMTKGNCDSYVELVERKKDLEKQKKAARKVLEAYDADFFAQYGESINRHLTEFGAGFKITPMETSYSGGRPSSSYFIEINSTNVDLTAQAGPSFSNTLSNGDRNALAFAFFLSKLEQDDELGNKIVIFDDPITSLDIHRKATTKRAVLRIGNMAKQTLVLSHDKYFLRELWEFLPAAEVKVLCLEREGQGTCVREWDILSATQNEHFKNYETLVSYIEGNNSQGTDLVAVARCLRPTLEGYLRMKYPMEFGRTEWLGDFIRKIGEAQAGDSLHGMQVELQELDALNDFSSPYHHNNPEVMIEPNDTELLTHATKVVEFIKR